MVLFSLDMMKIGNQRLWAKENSEDMKVLAKENREGMRMKEKKKQTFALKPSDPRNYVDLWKNSKEILGCSQKKKFFGLITFENRDHERKVIGGTELIMEESWGTQGIGNGGDFFFLGYWKEWFWITMLRLGLVCSFVSIYSCRVQSITLNIDFFPLKTPFS